MNFYYIFLQRQYNTIKFQLAMVFWKHIITQSSATQLFSLEQALDRL